MKNKMSVIIICYIAGMTWADVNVTVNPGIQYQTVLGWGASSWMPPWPSPELRSEIINEAVNDFGLTRLRLEFPSGNRSNEQSWEWLNDNGDPDNINWSAFNTASMDKRVVEVVLPFKLAVEANNAPFNVYLSPSFFNSGSSGAVPAWLRYSPGEYSEFAIALLTYLRNTYGIEADYYCILNEAGNSNPFTAALLARIIKVLAPRMQSLGFSTEIEFPECISAQTSWNYIQATQSDDDIWQYIGVVTYHLYGTNDPYRSYIRDFAISKGLPTGQTEYMGLTMNHLYDDFTLGGVSYWEIYGLGSEFQWNYNIYNTKGQYWNFRQVMHYVRPNATRIEAISDNANLRTLAFMHSGETTVIIINSSPAQTVHVIGLSAGVYGTCHSVNAGRYQELGLQTVNTSDTLTINVSANTVLTIYPYSGTNQPPTFTKWQADVDYLTSPSSSANLSALAVDPELDPISYLWTVVSQPGGASVNFGTPNAANTTVTGLSVAGAYIFTIAVSDPTHTVCRDIRITVFANNQPPLPDDVHNRLPVMITLPVDSTYLRAWAWDLEGDPLAYQWSVVSQPSGANVQLTNATTTNCKASDMSVPGDYIFELKVSDPLHTVSDTLVVPVYPVNTTPVISSISAFPDTLILPLDSTYLSATTYDPDGDTISHWWSVQSAPSGVSPIFTKQGGVNTVVRGLDVVGTYIFELTVVDRTKHTTDDVTVTVKDIGISEENNQLLPRSFHLSCFSPNPFNKITQVQYSLPEKIYTEVIIYNVQGQLVKTLVRRIKAPGYYTIYWDGKDDKGRSLPSGVYFCRMKTPEKIVTVRRIIFIK